jgi:hypothetical protein
MGQANARYGITLPWEPSMNLTSTRSLCLRILWFADEGKDTLVEVFYKTSGITRAIILIAIHFIVRSHKTLL